MNSEEILSAKGSNGSLDFARCHPASGRKTLVEHRIGSLLVSGVGCRSQGVT